MKTADTSEIRILLVDDHPFMREGLIHNLSEQTDLLVCGESCSVKAAIRAVPRVKPDVIVTDITMKGKSGLELIKELQQSYPKIPVVVLSMHDEKIYGERALEVGARGYVMKSAPPIQLIKAIRKAHAGGIQVSPDLSDILLSKILKKDGEQASRSEISRLTSREFEVFRLVGQGRKPHEIAADLGISIKTVNTHRSNMSEKLGFDSLSELLIYAVRWIESEKV